MMVRPIIFLLLGLNLGRVLGQEECGEAASSKIWEDLSAAFQYYLRCSYPTDKLNVDCIFSSCPSLDGVCPLASNESINQDALNHAVSILDACIEQEGLICGINMTRTPLTQISFSTTQLIPPEVANGTVTNIPGTAFLDNLANTRFSLPPQGISSNGSIILLIQAPDIVHVGNMNSTLSIAPTSFVNLFLSTLHTIPSMVGTFRLNLSSATVSIDLSSSPSPTVETLDSQSDLYSEFTNFINHIGEELPSTVVQPFNYWMKSFLLDSIIISTTTTFLSTYAALGLQAAQLNCPLHN